MEGHRFEPLHETEGKSRAIAVTPEFRQWLREHPGVLRSAAGLIDALDKAGESEIANEHIRVERPSFNYLGFKVEIDGNHFFVKKTNEFKPKEGGVHEIKRTHELAEKLKLKGVRVVDYKLGYTHGNNGYFVSAWEDVPRALEALDTDELQRRPELKDRLEAIYAFLVSEGVLDIGKHNLLYDKEKDEFVLFDLGN